VEFHHPIHKFEDNALYFLSARIYKSQPILKSDEKKELFLDSLKAGFLEVGYELFAWVILDDHYHIEFEAKEAKKLSGLINPDFAIAKSARRADRLNPARRGNPKQISNANFGINHIHGKFSYLFNKMDKSRGRKVFQNYWDTCIREEKDLWTRFNYIHHNPVKHGYCDRMEGYRFSSFARYLNEKGREWLDDCFMSYPVVDFTLKEGD